MNQKLLQIYNLQMVISNFLKSKFGWFQYLKTSLNFLVYSDEFEKKTF